MKLLQIILLLMLAFPVAPSQAQSRGKDLELSFPKATVVISGVEKSEFRTTINGSSAVIESLLYENVDGRTLRVDGNGLKNLTARIRFEFGALQYYNDDVRASPLDFSHKTEWTEIEIIGNQLVLPQYFSNHANVINVYQHLGYADSSSFERFLAANYFSEIKAKSYTSQKKFYESVLSDRRKRKRYEHCCPEYIEEAEKFLARKESDFTSMHDLSIEIFVPKMLLEITGTDASGKKFIYQVAAID